MLRYLAVLAIGVMVSAASLSYALAAVTPP
jgi:hypothetical protein